MPYNTFKEVKVKCNFCKSIVLSISDTEWTICPCGQTKVMGISFMRIQSKNYTDLSVLDFSKVPEHRGWNDKREQYYPPKGNK